MPSMESKQEELGLQALLENFSTMDVIPYPQSLLHWQLLSQYSWAIIPT